MSGSALVYNPGRLIGARRQNVYSTLIHVALLVVEKIGKSVPCISSLWKDIQREIELILGTKMGSLCVLCPPSSLLPYK